MMKKTLFSIQDMTQHLAAEFYHILFFEGDGYFELNSTLYAYRGCTILFLTPYQQLQWRNSPSNFINLQFHSDFYCIEYHKEEIACNGLLFNNIYLQPHITVSSESYNEIMAIVYKMQENEYQLRNVHSEAIAKSYLQLILALCSQEKQHLLDQMNRENYLMPEMHFFLELLEKHFLTEKSPLFYASELSISPETFARRVKQQFNKTPTQIIQERIILESQRLLHLTHKSVKEIAVELEFNDEFYFSRFFKKHIGVSPLNYRRRIGVSKVAYN